MDWTRPKATAANIRLGELPPAFPSRLVNDATREALGMLMMNT
jgi:hypothetical protein